MYSLEPLSCQKSCPYILDTVHKKAMRGWHCGGLGRDGLLQQKVVLHFMKQKGQPARLYQSTTEDTLVVFQNARDQGATVGGSEAEDSQVALVGEAEHRGGRVCHQ